MGKGVEVIVAPGKRYVWRADAFYIEQEPPSRPGERLGDNANLIVARLPQRGVYQAWSPDDEDTHTAPAEDTKIRPEDVLDHTVLARIPVGRFCFVHTIELDDESDVVLPRTHEDSGWWLPETKVQKDPKETLPTSVVGPDKLPMAPKRVKGG